MVVVVGVVTKGIVVIVAVIDVLVSVVVVVMTSGHALAQNG